MKEDLQKLCLFTLSRPFGGSVGVAKRTAINMMVKHDLMQFHQFERGFTLALLPEDVAACSHAGDCHADCAATVKKDYVEWQLMHISNETVKEELLDTGGWSVSEVQDPFANRERIVWLAACAMGEDNR